MSVTEDKEESVWVVENRDVAWQDGKCRAGFSQFFSQGFTQFDGHCFHLRVLGQGVLSKLSSVA